MKNKSSYLNPETLIREYKSLVAYHARKYSAYGVSREDLEQEGMLGLLEASTRFNSKQNVLFSTYAAYWIKKYILQAVNREVKYNSRNLELKDVYQADTATRPGAPAKAHLVLPEGMPEPERKIILLSYEKSVTLKEIASQLNLTAEKVRRIRDKALRRLRLNRAAE
jgi:RNA polymerase sigma factor (sigma-70 family)